MVAGNPRQPLYTEGDTFATKVSATVKWEHGADYVTNGTTLGLLLDFVHCTLENDFAIKSIEINFLKEDHHS